MLAACILMMTADAWPQQAEPVMGSAAGEAAQPADNQTIGHILVIGDAMGGGLGAGMQRMAEPAGRYDVSIRYNEESGLARPEVYDWNVRLPGILDSADYTVIVVMLGSNDRQQIRSGNFRYGFNSPDWVAAYPQQLDRMLDRLTGTGAKVYWIGLPPMADPEYDQALQVIGALQRARAEAKGATFLDMRPYFIGSDGRYTDMGVDDLGETRKLRGKDGVSFFKQGNNRMGQIVLAAIGQVAPIPPPAMAEKTGLEPASPASLPPAEAVVPVFGQMAGQFGEELLLQPRDVVATVVLIAGNGAVTPGSPEQVLAALAAAAKPGSSAATLFASGTAGPSPKGRLDDYSAPPADEN